MVLSSYCMQHEPSRGSLKPQEGREKQASPGGGILYTSRYKEATAAFSSKHLSEVELLLYSYSASVFAHPSAEDIREGNTYIENASKVFFTVESAFVCRIPRRVAIAGPPSL